MILTNNLRQIMDERHFTIRGLADKSDVSGYVVQNILDNKPVSMRTLGVLVDFFGLPAVAIVQMNPGNNNE